MQFENVNKFQVTAVTFNDTAELVVSGGIDNALKVLFTLCTLFKI